MKMFGMLFATLALVAGASSAFAVFESFDPTAAPSRGEHRPIPLPAALDADAVPAAEDAVPAAEGDPRVALEQVMGKYAEMTYVPYVYGGSKIGAKASCSACRACVDSKPKLKVERRMKACPVCSECGIDCSHFANRVFGDAGLKFPYAATKELTRSSAAELKAKLSLVDIGNDPRDARAGDLILFNKHVVMVLASTGDGSGDILHVSRSVKRHGMGGIEVVKGQKLAKFRGRILKILRHTRLHDGTTPVKRAPARHPRYPGFELGRHQLIVTASTRGGNEA